MSRPAARRHRLAALLLLLAAAQGAGAAEPSVLIATSPARRAVLPQTVTAWGVAGALPGGTTSLAFLHAGQVRRLFTVAGEAVHQGQTLLEFGADAAALMQWDEATSALKLARDERTRIAALLGQQLATRTQLAQADKAAADATAALDALRRQGAGKPVETLAAPFDGIIVTLAAQPGALVPAGTALVTLARADRLGVAIGIEPAERDKVRPGESVSLQPVEGGAALAGTVASRSAMIDPATRLVGAVVAVRGGTVLPGAWLRAEITVGQLAGWAVPRQSVLSDQAGAYLFQVAGGKAVRLAVRVLGSRGDTTVVDGPLDAARPLVTEGNYQLADGMAVRLGAAAGDPR